MKFIDIQKLKLCDVLAFSPDRDDLVGGAIDFFSWGGGTCHVAVVVDIDYRNQIVRIIESNSDKEPRGVRERQLCFRELQLIKVYRDPKLEFEVDVKRLIEWFWSKVGCQYDLIAFPSTWFRSVFCRVFGWKHYQKTPTLIHGTGYYCSNLIALGWYEVFNSILVKGLHPSSVTPNDLVGGKSSLVRVL